MASVTHSTGALSSVQGSAQRSHGTSLPRVQVAEHLKAGRQAAQPARLSCRRHRAREADHEGVEAQRLPVLDLREDTRQRAGDVLGEGVVRGRRRDVERDDAVGREVATRELEELARREVEGHVGLPVGVDEDGVVAGAARGEERARVGGVHDEVRVVAEAEVASGDRGDLGIDLDAVVAHLGEEDPEGPAVVPPALPSMTTRCAGRPRSPGAMRNMSHSPPVSTVSGRHSEWIA